MNRIVASGDFEGVTGSQASRRDPRAQGSATRRMKSKWFGTAALVTAISGMALPIYAQVYAVDTKHSDVSFQIRHLVGKVRGRFTEFTGSAHVTSDKGEVTSVDLSIQAASISTGHQGRDKHLRDPRFFDVEKHPTIAFVSDAVVRRSANEYEVRGKLTMRGVTRDVTLPIAILGRERVDGAEVVAIETETTLNRKDFGMIYNRVLDNGGVQIGDEVSISINLELVEEVVAPAGATATKGTVGAQPSK